MSTRSAEITSPAARAAREFHHAKQAAICDVIAPFSHGTLVRASSYPSYYEFNLLRLEAEPLPSLEQLKAKADEALGDLAHRRIDFELAAEAEPLRAGFHAAGWRTTRLLWMRHDGAPRPRPQLAAEEVDYEEAMPLRVEWHHEDFPDDDPSAYHDSAREVARLLGTRTLIVREDSSAVGYVELEQRDGAAEITSVYVSPRARGEGRGTAITRAAMAAAGDVEDLWIVADDEDRPKQLYARLGFVPVCKILEATRWP